MDVISKESVGHVIGRDYLVLHMHRPAMVSSWAKFTSHSVLYDDGICTVYDDRRFGAGDRRRLNRYRERTKNIGYSSDNSSESMEIGGGKTGGFFKFHIFGFFFSPSGDFSHPGFWGSFSGGFIFTGGYFGDFRYFYWKRGDFLFCGDPKDYRGNYYVLCDRAYFDGRDFVVAGRDSLCTGDQSRTDGIF